MWVVKSLMNRKQRTDSSLESRDDWEGESQSQSGDEESDSDYEEDSPKGSKANLSQPRTPQSHHSVGDTGRTTTTTTNQGNETDDDEAFTSPARETTPQSSLRDFSAPITSPHQRSTRSSHHSAGGNAATPTSVSRSSAASSLKVAKGTECRGSGSTRGDADTRGTTHEGHHGVPQQVGLQTSPKSEQGAEVTRKLATVSDVSMGESSLPQEGPPVLIGSVYSIQGEDFECIAQDGTITFNEDGLSATQPHSVKAEIDFPYDRICGFQQHMVDAFQWTIRNKKGDSGEEYGLQLDTIPMAASFRRQIEAKLTSFAVVLISQNCVLFDYDSSRQSMARVKPESVQTVTIAQRPSDLEAFFIVRDGETGTLLFQDVLSHSMQLWPVAANKQLTFWGPDAGSVGGERRVYMVELAEPLLLIQDGDVGVTEFQLFNVIDEVLCRRETKAKNGADQGYGLNAVMGKINEEDSEFDTGIDSATDSSMMEDITWADSVTDDEDDVVEVSGDKGGSEQSTSLAPTPFSGSGVTHRQRGGKSRVSIACDPTREIYESNPSEMVHKFMVVGKGNTFVCRESTGGSKGVSAGGAVGPQAELQVYRRGDANQDQALVTKATLNANKFNYNGQSILPNHGLLHSSERHLLVTDVNDHNSVYSMDLEREQIIQKFDPGSLPIHSMTHTTKGAQETSDPTFICTNPRSMFVMDTRTSDKPSKGAAIGVPSTGNRQHTLMYSSNVQLSVAATTANGGIVTGSRLGDIRLFDGGANRDGDLKRAKTHLETIRETITAIDTTASGDWVVATMKTYLVVFPTRLSGGKGKTGFEVALGKKKPPPRYLRLRPEDLAKHRLIDISFSPARFDKEEDAIVTSTGDIAVIWSMSSIRKNNPTYQTRVTQNYIKDVKVDAEDPNSVVVAYPQSLGLFGTQKTRRKTMM